eukprot:TRINITY_DN21978_c1_g1_i1.p1 TRINITY_DN21978_c1_g1~~TRINITY_DN21978_c1_g1_i1.p1  ORF type:complete len:350 (+),score=24.31 TRINITY_DN21978_c1_g1_i1:60-1109(+)
MLLSRGSCSLAFFCCPSQAAFSAFGSQRLRSVASVVDMALPMHDSLVSEVPAEANSHDEEDGLEGPDESTMMGQQPCYGGKKTRFFQILSLIVVAAAILALGYWIGVRNSAGESVYSSPAPHTAVPPLTSMSCPYFSPTFPSAGGPDCTYPCQPGTRSVGTAFFSVFPPGLQYQLQQAGKLIRALDAEGTVYTEGGGKEAFMDSHVSFSYYCCHTEDELSRIKALLQTWKGWTPHNVSLSYVTCAIDGPALDHVSFILMLDEASNNLMHRWVASLQEDLARVGVKVNIPRSHQEPYHITVAVVNGTRYPVAEAIRQINEQFPPERWLQKPLTLTRPCGAHGETPAGFFC